MAFHSASFDLAQGLFWHRLIRRKVTDPFWRQPGSMDRGWKIGMAFNRAQVLAPVAVLTACAHQPSPNGGAGFFTGLFQGLTALLSLIGSLFLPVRPYAFPNAGFWYDAGFCLGFSTSVVLMILFSIARFGALVTRGH